MAFNAAFKMTMEQTSSIMSKPESRHHVYQSIIISALNDPENLKDVCRKAFKDIGIPDMMQDMSAEAPKLRSDSCYALGRLLDVSSGVDYKPTPHSSTEFISKLAFALDSTKQSSDALHILWTLRRPVLVECEAMKSYLKPIFNICKEALKRIKSEVDKHRPSYSIAIATLHLVQKLIESHQNTAADYTVSWFSLISPYLFHHIEEVRMKCDAVIQAGHLVLISNAGSVLSMITDEQAMMRLMKDMCGCMEPRESEESRISCLKTWMVIVRICGEEINTKKFKDTLILPFKLAFSKSLPKLQATAFKAWSVLIQKLPHSYLCTCVRQMLIPLIVSKRCYNKDSVVSRIHTWMILIECLDKSFPEHFSEICAPVLNYLCDVSTNESVIQSQRNKYSKMLVGTLLHFLEQIPPFEIYRVTVNGGDRLSLTPVLIKDNYKSLLSTLSMCMSGKIQYTKSTQEIIYLLKEGWKVLSSGIIKLTNNSKLVKDLISTCLSIIKSQTLVAQSDLVLDLILPLRELPVDILSSKSYNPELQMNLSNSMSMNPALCFIEQLTKIDNLLFLSNRMDIFLSCYEVLVKKGTGSPTFNENMSTLSILSQRLHILTTPLKNNPEILNDLWGFVVSRFIELWKPESKVTESVEVCIENLTVFPLTYTSQLVLETKTWKSMFDQIEQLTKISLSIELCEKLLSAYLEWLQPMQADRNKLSGARYLQMLQITNKILMTACKSQDTEVTDLVEKTKKNCLDLVIKYLKLPSITHGYEHVKQCIQMLNCLLMDLTSKQRLSAVKLICKELFNIRVFHDPTYDSEQVETLWSVLVSVLAEIKQPSLILNLGLHCCVSNVTREAIQLCDEMYSLNNVPSEISSSLQNAKDRLTPTKSPNPAVTSPYPTPPSEKQTPSKSLTHDYPRTPSGTKAAAFGTPEWFAAQNIEKKAKKSPLSGKGKLKLTPHQNEVFKRQREQNVGKMFGVQQEDPDSQFFNEIFEIDPSQLPDSSKSQFTNRNSSLNDTTNSKRKMNAPTTFPSSWVKKRRSEDDDLATPLEPTSQEEMITVNDSISSSQQISQSTDNSQIISDSQVVSSQSSTDSVLPVIDRFKIFDTPKNKQMTLQSESPHVPIRSPAELRQKAEPPSKLVITPCKVIIQKDEVLDFLVSQTTNQESPSTSTANKTPPCELSSNQNPPCDTLSNQIPQSENLSNQKSENTEKSSSESSTSQHVFTQADPKYSSSIELCSLETGENNSIEMSIPTLSSTIADSQESSSLKFSTLEDNISDITTQSESEGTPTRPGRTISQQSQSQEGTRVNVNKRTARKTSSQSSNDKFKYPLLKPVASTVIELKTIEFTVGVDCCKTLETISDYDKVAVQKKRGHRSSRRAGRPSRRDPTSSRDSSLLDNISISSQDSMSSQDWLQERKPVWRRMSRAERLAGRAARLSQKSTQKSSRSPITLSASSLSDSSQLSDVKGDGIKEKAAGVDQSTENMRKKIGADAVKTKRNITDHEQTEKQESSSVSNKDTEDRATTKSDADDSKGGLSSPKQNQHRNDSKSSRTILRHQNMVFKRIQSLQNLLQSINKEKDGQTSTVKPPELNELSQEVIELISKSEKMTNILRYRALKEQLAEIEKSEAVVSEKFNTSRERLKQNTNQKLSESSPAKKATEDSEKRTENSTLAADVQTAIESNVKESECQPKKRSDHTADQSEELNLTISNVRHQSPMKPQTDNSEKMDNKSEQSAKELVKSNLSETTISDSETEAVLSVQIENETIFLDSEDEETVWDFNSSVEHDTTPKAQQFLTSAPDAAESANEGTDNAAVPKAASETSSVLPNQTPSEINYETEQPGFSSSSVLPLNQTEAGIVPDQSEGSKDKIEAPTVSTDLSQTSNTVVSSIDQSESSTVATDQSQACNSVNDPSTLTTDQSEPSMDQNERNKTAEVDKVELTPTRHVSEQSPGVKRLKLGNSRAAVMLQKSITKNSPSRTSNTKMSDVVTQPATPKSKKMLTLDDFDFTPTISPQSSILKRRQADYVNTPHSKKVKFDLPEPVNGIDKYTLTRRKPKNKNETAENPDTEHEIEDGVEPVVDDDELVAQYQSTQLTEQSEQPSTQPAATSATQPATTSATQPTTSSTTQPTTSSATQHTQQPAEPTTERPTESTTEQSTENNSVINDPNDETVDSFVILSSQENRSTDTFDDSSAVLPNYINVELPVELLISNLTTKNCESELLEEFKSNSINTVSMLASLTQSQCESLTVTEPKLKTIKQSVTLSNIPTLQQIENYDTESLLTSIHHITNSSHLTANHKITAIKYLLQNKQSLNRKVDSSEVISE